MEFGGKVPAWGRQAPKAQGRKVCEQRNRAHEADGRGEERAVEDHWAATTRGRHEDHQKQSTHQDGRCLTPLRKSTRLSPRTEDRRKARARRGARKLEKTQLGVHSLNRRKLQVRTAYMCSIMRLCPKQILGISGGGVEGWRGGGGDPAVPTKLGVVGVDAHETIEEVRRLVTSNPPGKSPHFPCTSQGQGHRHHRYGRP